MGVREVVNFDNIGRGNLAIRPSAPAPGYVFTIPFYGDMVYDGRGFRQGVRYPLADQPLSQALARAQPALVVLERFTALTDSNVFQANSIPTVAISGDDMHFLDETWHTYSDKIELLDQANLDQTFELITHYPSSN